MYGKYGIERWEGSESESNALTFDAHLYGVSADSDLIASFASVIAVVVDGDVHY